MPLLQIWQPGSKPSRVRLRHGGAGKLAEFTQFERVCAVELRQRSSFPDIGDIEFNCSKWEKGEQHQDMTDTFSGVARATMPDAAQGTDAPMHQRSCST